MTPAGTRPGDKVATPGSPAKARSASSGSVAPSARYTPPVPHGAQESPPWVPALMLTLFVLGGVAIMLRYLVFSDSNVPMVIGLACLLGGLYTATKWR